MKLRRELRALARRTGNRVQRARQPGVPSDDWGGSPIRPIFIGGTGRSGTTITSSLLSHQPTYQRLRTEVKFISNRGGLCDLVEGRTTVDEFERRLHDKWFDRGEVKGLKVILDWEDIEAALGPLREGIRGNRYAAAGAFAHRLLDPFATEKDKSAWLEMTPSAALEADTVYRIFPNMKLLHLVRDGRDVACSLLRMTWGPNDPLEGLDWWDKRLTRAYAACERIPSDRVLVVQLEDLVVHDRDRVYARILSFLGVEDVPEMRAFFDTRMPAEAMHLGRWRTEVPPEILPRFEQRYEEIVDRLRSRGFDYHVQPEAIAADA